MKIIMQISLVVRHPNKDLLGKFYCLYEGEGLIITNCHHSWKVIVDMGTQIGTKGQML